MEYFEQNASLTDFAENIRPYVKAVISHEFGLMHISARLFDVDTGNASMNNLGDRFFIKINYCQKILHWRVMMNSKNLREPPDFLMEDNFLLALDANAEMMKTNVPSLANWDPTDEKCLLNVILELVNLYKDYQLYLMKIDSSLHRFLFEHDSLLLMTRVEKSDIEVCINNSHRGTTVVFYISINVDFSHFPRPLPEHQNLAILTITFTEGSNTSIGLHLCSEVEETLEGSPDLPDLHPDNSLIDYVPLVADKLQTKISNALQRLKKRQRFYYMLMHFIEPAILNLDVVMFKEANFLIEQPHESIICSVLVTSEFPKVAPKVKFLFPMKFRNGSPMSEDLPSFPYSPRWNWRDMVVKMLEAVSRFLSQQKT